jgi:catechol 2,3-dioxygenase-like lactoylglutathione lyase family enzyme
VRLEVIDHAQLAMPAGQEDSARRFYGGLLGLPEQTKPPHLAVRGGAWFESGSVKVHLGVDSDFHPARKAHVAFVVDDVKELRQRATAAGYEVDDGEPLAGYRSATGSSSCSRTVGDGTRRPGAVLGHVATWHPVRRAPFGRG